MIWELTRKVSLIFTHDIRILPCVSESLEGAAKAVDAKLDFCVPVYAELWKTGLFDRMNIKTDEDEHSIEMHLPYTAKAMER